MQLKFNFACIGSEPNGERQQVYRGIAIAQPNMSTRNLLPCNCHSNSNIFLNGIVSGIKYSTSVTSHHCFCYLQHFIQSQGSACLGKATEKILVKRAALKRSED